MITTFYSPFPVSYIGPYVENGKIMSSCTTPTICYTITWTNTVSNSESNSISKHNDVFLESFCAVCSIWTTSWYTVCSHTKIGLLHITTSQIQSPIFWTFGSFFSMAMFLVLFSCWFHTISKSGIFHIEEDVPKHFSVER